MRISSGCDDNFLVIVERDVASVFGKGKFWSAVTWGGGGSSDFIFGSQCDKGDDFGHFRGSLISWSGHVGHFDTKLSIQRDVGRNEDLDSSVQNRRVQSAQYIAGLKNDIEGLIVEVIKLRWENQIEILSSVDIDVALEDKSHIRVIKGSQIVRGDFNVGYADDTVNVVVDILFGVEQTGFVVELWEGVLQNTDENVSIGEAVAHVLDTGTGDA